MGVSGAMLAMAAATALRAATSAKALTVAMSAEAVKVAKGVAASATKLVSAAKALNTDTVVTAGVSGAMLAKAVKKLRGVRCQCQRQCETKRWSARCAS